GPVTSIRGTSTTSGYNTVPLDTSVELAAGQKFSVVMKLTNPVYKYPIAVEIPFEDWSSKAKANAGESFVSSAGEAWYDLKSYSVYQNTNVRIKAFTDLILLPIEDFNTNVTSDYIKAFTDLILLPIAGFSTNVTSGYVPLSVQFTDLSENAETWNWDFGGGATSNDQNPVHTYSTAGTYTVTLEISNEYGTDSKTATIDVLKSTPAIIWFNPDNITNGTALSNIQLNAVATDPVTGNIVHGECVYTPPSGTILDVGSHILHVDFTPADIANYNTASKDFSINVLEPLFPPVASFRSNVTDGKPPLTVQFTDLSVEGSEQSWDFEDKTYSTDKNPVYL
ncbi:MAG: hypothetical protein QG610_2530, partial [Euryarchaeota archaeon]|nr:hypothetical protein [Euryarchaeota archaeon]